MLASTGLKLGLDTYTLRAFRWNAFQLLDYAEKVGWTRSNWALPTLKAWNQPMSKKSKTKQTGLVSRSTPLSDAYAVHHPFGRRKRAIRRGTCKGLRLARGLGSRNVHVFMGGFPERRGPVPFEKHVEETSRAMRSV